MKKQIMKLLVVLVLLVLTTTASNFDSPIIRKRTTNPRPLKQA